ncbi:MAG: YtxH-like protein [Chloroflexi bacterium]|jgi:gas vesicle protein|nr:YtxH-like protein [Chloroflexota bacterium]
MNEPKNLINFLIGLTTGALVGVSLALLFAPSSGDELRGQIQGQVQRIQDEVGHAAELRRAELERQLAELRAPRRPG